MRALSIYINSPLFIFHLRDCKRKITCVCMKSTTIFHLLCCTEKKTKRKIRQKTRRHTHASTHTELSKTSEHIYCCKDELVRTENVNEIMDEWKIRFEAFNLNVFIFHLIHICIAYNSHAPHDSIYVACTIGHVKMHIIFNIKHSGLAFRDGQNGRINSCRR